MNIIIEGYNKFDIIVFYFEVLLGMLLVYGIKKWKIYFGDRRSEIIFCFLITFGFVVKF